MLNTIFRKPIQRDVVLIEDSKDVIQTVPNPAPNTQGNYAKAAEWAESNNATIVEYGPTSEYPEGFFRVEPLPAPSVQEILAEAKAERAAAVAAITVEVDGMIFDGDEAAQERMARAVLMAESMDEETEWVLADNTVAVVTADQLRRACKAAGKAQTALWTVPYQN